MEKSNIHPNFQLNGIAISENTIVELSYSLIKEGEDFEKEIGDFLLQWVDVNDTIIVETSGSTGEPKSIKLQKKHMVNSALATGDFFNLKPKYSALLCMSTNFIAGKMMLVRAMVLGLHLTAVPAKLDPLDGLVQTFDFCAMVPMQLQNSLDKIERIETVIIGGAPMSKNLKDKLQGIKTQVFETYGMTETITHIALKKINSSSANVFTTLAGVVVSKDERDCMVINAPRISDAPIITNDIIELLSKTEFTWLGRYDSIINSGGIKLIPEQIEEKLAKVIEDRFFVTGIPDDILGQKLVLIIESKTENPDILAHVQSIKGLDKYERPKEVLFLKAFIETTSGKINRKKTIHLLSC
ncbi:AMP-binding protein [Maribacter sp.]|uniref:AMP-binding protein n=1 Tax=Maribacter sp. TaxID=1897614 RepID=UPI0025B828CF|nr:AMP-binding protein [Maribacter sp.]